MTCVTPERSFMLRHTFTWTLLATSLASFAVAQDSVLPLPKLEACRSASHPRLPEKWHATYLMAPFTRSQLVLGEIVVDDSISAMRVKLFGLRHGSADLFVSGDRTYALASDGSAVSDCQDLGDTGWRPLDRDWLTPRSRCTGSAPIGETGTDWWKTPIEPKPSSYWIWYETAEQTPLRLVFPAPSDRLAVLSRYALSHRVAFKAVAETELAALAQTCRGARPGRGGTGPRALLGIIEGLSQARDRADREIKRLMPAVASCASSPLPQWPETLALTGLMTPFDANENPYPTEVLYDWTLRGQRSRIYFPPASPVLAQDALLLGSRGYNVTWRRDDGPVCTPVLPGTIRPDWPSRGSCSCEAEISGGTPLTPRGTTRIIACTLASPRAAWAWYTADGRPTTFMVTSRIGDQGAALFAVLDYWQWEPGHQIAGTAFAKPDQCKAPTPARVSAHLLQCATCH